jgi:hypothetical protein
MRDALVVLASSPWRLAPRTSATACCARFLVRQYGTAGLGVTVRRQDTNKFLLETTGCGVAVWFDNDGWLDLFIVNGSVLEVSIGSNTDGASVSQST